MTARTRPVPAIVSLGTLLLLACFVWGGVFAIQPLGGDNVRILFWADGASASAVIRADPVVYPEWRPLPYLAVWSQYRWFGFDHLPVHYAINLLFWLGCAWLVYRIADRLGRSSMPALFAAAVLLTDSRAMTPMMMFERADLMACFFGLAALLVVVCAREQRVTWLAWVGVWLLLLASSLSKEYGLAFTCAVAMSALYDRRRDAATAAIAAGVTYAVLRIGFAGGAIAAYCEDEGYFFTLRQVCYDGSHSLAVAQAAYNVAATVVSSVLPGLFSVWGQIGIDSRWVARSAVWLAVALIGWSKGPPPMRMMLLVVVFNAALSFMLFAYHNQLVALCGLCITLGVGLAIADAAVQTSARSRLLRWTFAAALVALLAQQAVATRELVSVQAADSRRRDPCLAVANSRPLDVAFVTRLKTAYGLPNPGCVPGH